MIKENDLSLLLLFVNHTGDVWETNRPFTNEEQVIENEMLEDLALRGSRLYKVINLIKERLPELEEDRFAYERELFEIGKLVYGKENLRQYFSDLYCRVTERISTGPNVGEYVSLLGREKFIETLTNELEYFNL